MPKYQYVSASIIHGYCKDKSTYNLHLNSDRSIWSISSFNVHEYCLYVKLKTSPYITTSKY